jgi:uncharacterized protein YegL
MQTPMPSIRPSLEGVPESSINEPEIIIAEIGISEPKIKKRVFISYSPEDQELYEKLNSHLSPLKRSMDVIFWSNQEILAGENSEDEIITHLFQADIILLLVSPDFIHNDHCWEETKIALLRHKTGTARIVPIVLRPTFWQNTPLQQIKALPTGAKPLTQWENQDAGFESVVRDLQYIIKGGRDDNKLSYDVFDALEFSENPEPRCPCILLLDTSTSMRGVPLEALNKGLQIFQADLHGDLLASLRIEITIITFGNEEIQILPNSDRICISSFSTFSDGGGAIPMGTAIMCALDLLHKRKSLLQAVGIPYFRPWIFLITNSLPTDYWQLATAFIQNEEREKRLAFFVVGTANVNIEKLGQIAVRQPLMLQDLKFPELFRWLSRNLKYACGRFTRGSGLLELTTTDEWAQLNNKAGFGDLYNWSVLEGYW